MAERPGLCSCRRREVVLPLATAFCKGLGPHAGRASGVVHEMQAQLRNSLLVARAYGCLGLSAAHGHQQNRSGAQRSAAGRVEPWVPLAPGGVHFIGSQSGQQARSVWGACCWSLACASGGQRGLGVEGSAHSTTAQKSVLRSGAGCGQLSVCAAWPPPRGFLLLMPRQLPPPQLLPRQLPPPACARLLRRACGVTPDAA